MIQEIEISKIKIHQRLRKDLGDLQPLVNSIKSEGLLQPICLRKDLTLVAGYRRIKAFEILNRTTISVHVISLENLLKGEWAENEYRKELTVSERVEYWDELKRQEGIIHGNNQFIKKEDKGGGGKNVTQDLPDRGNPLYGAKPPQITVAPTTPSASLPPTPAIHTLAGFSSKKIAERASLIIKKGSPELISKMDNNEISIDAANKLTKLPPSYQNNILSKSKGEQKFIINSLSKPTNLITPLTPITPPQCQEIPLKSMEFPPNIIPILHSLEKISNMKERSLICIWIRSNWGTKQND